MIPWHTHVFRDTFHYRSCGCNLVSVSAWSHRVKCVSSVVSLDILPGSISWYANTVAILEVVAGCGSGGSLGCRDEYARARGYGRRYGERCMCSFLLVPDACGRAMDGGRTGLSSGCLKSIQRAPERSTARFFFAREELILIESEIPAYRADTTSNYSQCCLYHVAQYG